MAGRITYRAYRDADEWERQGLIGDTLQFTDDEIVTQQAIGYTKNLCGYNCPMDIAVVYSMLNRGQGATPTARELLNDHTRAAYYFEAGIVADGFVYEPTEEVYTCTPTADFPQLSYSGSSYGNLRHTPALDPAKLAGFIAKILEKKDVGLMNALLDAYNWEGGHRHTFANRAARGDYKDFFLFKRDGTVNNQPFQDMMKAQHDEGETVRASTVIALIQEYVSWEINTNDRCNRHADEEQYCTTHKPKNFYNRTWVIAPEGTTIHGMRLYRNEPVSQYQQGNAHLNKNHHFTMSMVRFSDHKRRLIQEVNDKEVLKLINKSLTRMAKRGTVRQVSSGRGRMFEWTAWSWLGNIRTRILASNAKQRKIGDEVNGWKYTTGRTTESFGMQIHDHDWQPVEDLHYYTVEGRFPSTDTWSGIDGRIDKKRLIVPIVFFDEASAHAHMNHMKSFSVYSPAEAGLDCVPTQRKFDSDFNVSSPEPTWSVEKNSVSMSVDGIAVIEDYDTPQDMYKAMQVGNQTAWESMAGLLRNVPHRLTRLVTQ